LYSGFCNTSNQGSGFVLPLSVRLSFAQNPLGCVGIGQFGMTVGAASPAVLESNDSAFNLLGFLYAKNNSLTAMNDAGTFDINLANPWSSTTTSQIVVEKNIPNESVWYQKYAFYSEVANGVLFPLPPRTLPDGGALPPDGILYTTHGGYADFVQTEIGYNPRQSGLVQAALALATRAPAPTQDGTTTVDWAPLATLPALTDIQVDATTPAQPKLTWTTPSGTLSAVTGVLVWTRWNYDGASGVQQGEWTIVSPGTAASSLQAPKLPAGSEFAPIMGSGFNTATVYAIQGGTAVPTYAGLRATSSAFYLQNACVSQPVIPALPTAGTLMASAYTSGGCG
jgi:hypothetical protein